MKINEKNLSVFAVSATPVDKEGYLSKKWETNKSFQRNYFVLKGNLLFYFEKKFDKEPLGVIILEGCSIELAEDEGAFSFVIAFHGSTGRKYVLSAENQDVMEQWMKALACASYDYMCFMVADLQRQLDGLGESPLPLEVQSATNSPIPPPRTRLNPFNKPDSNIVHQRPNNRPLSSRSAEEFRKPTDVTSKASITFRELHNSYGRPILMDFNIWKRQHEHTTPLATLTADSTIVENLITL